MPAWTPNWEDVRFDHGAAHQYSNVCRLTSTELRRIAATRVHLAAEAVIGWEGPSRVRFDRDGEKWTAAAEQAAMQLESIAASVDAAAAAAHQMQAARLAQRDQWHAELAAEQQAAEQQAAERAAAEVAAADRLAAADQSR